MIERISDGWAMVRSRWGGSVEHNPGRAGALCGAWAALLLACAGAGGPPRAELGEALLATSTPLAEGALRIRLAFSADADLDLYVSDPLQETVYYANTPSASGGALAADRRCGDPRPRIEAIEFATPIAGRYRVGVDYPRACGRRARPAAFAVEVRHGIQRVVYTGVAAPIRFEPAFAEIELAH